MLECWCGVNQTGWSRYICCSSLGLHQHHQHFMMWRNSAIFHFSPLNYKDNKQERKRCEMRLTIWPMIPDVYNLSLRLRIWRNMRGSSDTPVVLWSTRITFIKYSRLKSHCGCWLAIVLYQLRTRDKSNWSKAGQVYPENIHCYQLSWWCEGMTAR